MCIHCDISTARNVMIAIGTGLTVVASRLGLDIGPSTCIVGLLALIVTSIIGVLVYSVRSSSHDIEKAQISEDEEVTDEEVTDEEIIEKVEVEKGNREKTGMFRGWNWYFHCLSSSFYQPRSCESHCTCASGSGTDVPKSTQSVFNIFQTANPVGSINVASTNPCKSLVTNQGTTPPPTSAVPNLMTIFSTSPNQTTTTTTSIKKPTK